MLKFFYGTKGQLLTLIVALTMIFGALSAMGWITVGDPEELPDLLIQSIDYTPTRPVKNDIIDVMSTIKNSGDADAYNIEVALYINSRSTDPTHTLIIPVLPQGENITVNLYWTAVLEGDFTIFVWIDYQNKIEETDEENNWESKDIFVESEIISSFPPKQEFRAEWWDSQWHYRLPLSIQMPGFQQELYQDKLVNLSIDFTEVMADLDVSPDAIFDPNSTRIIEYRENQGFWSPLRKLPQETIFHPNFDPETNANLTLIWIVNGTNKPQSVRHYYIYWDTINNGEKAKEPCAITQGIKNSDFEAINCSSWENSTGGLNWRIEVTDDDFNTGGQSIKITREGLLWQEGDHANISQRFYVPEMGTALQYWLHTTLKFNPGKLKNDITWSILLDDNEVISGTEPEYGWKDIVVNVTDALEDKVQSTLVLRVESTEQRINITEIEMDWDTCWIETKPSAIIMEYPPAGWWGNITVETEYLSGVYSHNMIDFANISATAVPYIVTASLYDPDDTLTKTSLPLPDAGFEGTDEYTVLYESERTGKATFHSEAYHGNVSVQLALEKYEGTWWWEPDQEIKNGDHAAFKQALGKGFPASQLPDLWFWYNISRYDFNSHVEYTLITTGSPPQHHQIEMDDLKKNGEWNRYDIPQETLDTWKELTSTVTDIEIRLVAKLDNIRNTRINIDNLGCAVYENDALDKKTRTVWILEDFYEFQHNETLGNWTLEITFEDATAYRFDAHTQIQLQPTANLEVSQIITPQDRMEGETVNISVMIKNHGPKNISSTDVSLTIFQNDDQTDVMKITQSVKNINASEEKEVQFRWEALYGKPAYYGEWTVVGQIDPQNQVVEWDETNNWNSSIITIIAAPDLQMKMDDLNFDPPHATFNETMEISMIIHNIGFENAAQDETAITLSYMHEKQPDDEWNPDETIFFTNVSVLKLNEKTLSTNWIAPQEGNYTFLARIECKKELKDSNNNVVKDIRIGGPDDTTSPTIEMITVPSTPKNYEAPFNITARITDDITTIDRVSLKIQKENGETVKEEIMDRNGFTDFYFCNITLQEIGYYSYTLRAWDTSLNNNQETTKGSIRTINENIEINPPKVRDIEANPNRQVIGGYIEISAEITDETGVSEPFVYIRYPDDNQFTPYAMDFSGSRYIYNSSYENTGEYLYYIWVQDTSLNKNVNSTEGQINQRFNVPLDYDEDGVPDDIELSIGSNPRDKNDSIKVTVTSNGATKTGYLIWDGEIYKYWDTLNDDIRDTVKEDIDEDGIDEILFDTDGDGENDYFYDTETGGIDPISEPIPEDEDEWENYLLLIPLLALLVVIFLIYGNIRKFP